MKQQVLVMDHRFWKWTLIVGGIVLFACMGCQFFTIFGGYYLCINIREWEKHERKTRF